MKVRTRIQVLTELLVSGSQRIIDHYQLLQHDEEKRGVCEAYRLENPPHIDRKRLWKILKLEKFTYKRQNRNKKKSNRLRGRSSETAKAHRG
eukprot:TRINITY_DN2363_c0_g1_i2.p3 TRINITY_DN2363_c0_g1~~TRINITY_DN2363_c0_g1_i2.p3  ORF type:complete len:92 (+),score=19.00 TRINITY_DN2363_c0_g1_i2:949-1224(+)